MIETYYGQEGLASPQAMLAAGAIGAGFGFALERAGFGSSRRLAGIFYFRDMAVLKVMFSAMVVAMLGLIYALGTGLIDEAQIYHLPSVYGAYVVGGLLFGVGFVMGGWCPGTAAVGVASGKLDALVFLGGAMAGSVLFNECFGLIEPLYGWGSRGVAFAWQSLGMSKAGFALLFTCVAVGCFWGSEYIERRRAGEGRYLNSPFLRAWSVALVVLAVGALILPDPTARGTGAADAPAQGAPHVPGSNLLATIEAGRDHIEPAELADRLMRGDPDLLLVDVRTESEYQAFHLPSAIHVPPSRLADALAGRRDRGLIVLYSNGMTHPAQARDALARLGFGNVYILTDGLRGFMETCLKPASLRDHPLPPSQVARVNAWRAFFTSAEPVTGAPVGAAPSARARPGMVEAAWLADNIGRADLRVLDCRSQADYSRGHIPGSLRVSPEQFRGARGGVPSMLLPGAILAQHLELMGIRPSDQVVIVAGDSLRDATLVGMVFERLGHGNHAILSGGFARWVAEAHPTDTRLPDVVPSSYPFDPAADRFTVDRAFVLQRVRDRAAVIIDVRPADYYAGTRSDEARAGHVPGALNRPYTEDVVVVDKAPHFKSITDLEQAYAKLIPDRDTTVLVHCRTGHQASQAFFVLRNLLGYDRVLWYDAGWTEWAARQELPVEGPAAAP